MSIAELIEKAENPQAALVVVGTALDEILERLAAAESKSDGWGEWASKSQAAVVGAVTATHDGDSTEVVFHDAPPAVKEQRGAFATEKINLAEAFPELGEEAQQAYVNGGPLWLYMYNRDFVLSMPANLRREMVEDVAQYDPQAAHDLGLDICKQGVGDGGVPDWTPGA